MSGATIIAPNTGDTTLEQDSQAAGSITPGDERQIHASLAGLFTSTQGSNYTFVLADRGTMVEGTMLVGTAATQSFTIPPNSTAAFTINTVIAFRQYGTSQLTIVAGAGVTLRTASSLTARAQYSSGSIHKRATDEWVVAGDMT
jgi:hypothetical protein